MSPEQIARLRREANAGLQTGAGVNAHRVIKLLDELDSTRAEVTAQSYGDARAAVDKTRITDARIAALEARVRELERVNGIQRPNGATRLELTLPQHPATVREEFRA